MVVQGGPDQVDQPRHEVGSGQHRRRPRRAPAAAGHSTTRRCASRRPRSAPPAGRGAPRRTPRPGRGSSGSSASTSGGSTNRSTRAAQPCTVSGQVIAVSCSSSGALGGQALLLDRGQRGVAEAVGQVRLARDQLARSRPGRTAGPAGPSRPPRRAARSRARPSARPSSTAPGSCAALMTAGLRRRRCTAGSGASWSLPHAVDLGDRVLQGRRLGQPHRAVVAGEGVGAVGRRHQEQLGAVLPGAGDLLLDAADLARPCRRRSMVPVPATHLAVGERARRERVVDRQREHQAGARAADRVADVAPRP